jgi:tellurite resistance protein TerC
VEVLGLVAAESGGRGNFVEIDAHAWQWGVLLAIIVVLLMVDILIIHRKAHVIHLREAAIEAAIWISCGLAFALAIWAWFGGAATGEYLSGYLIEESLSIDNVFVWALILAYFRVPAEYQHRVLFWGIFGALVLRATFIFAGIALIERFDWVLYVFGAFLLYTAAKLIISDNEHVDPGKSRFLKVVNRIVPSTDRLDGQRLFTRVSGKRLATPLFAVLVLVEGTDVLFAVDSVPAVLAVSREQFIVFSSNAFAILGLRAMYFLLADLHGRFSYLQQGLAIILAFVGVKMLINEWYHIPTWLSLVVIVLVLGASVGFSLKSERLGVESGSTEPPSDRPPSDRPPSDRPPSDRPPSHREVHADSATSAERGPPFDER